MARKHSLASRGAEPPKIDDLKLINGIGPGVEKRLNGVGIYTFAQLATLSPADIAASVADLAGLSAERIIKQDWIGQARKLASESISSEAQEGTRQVATSTGLVEPQVSIKRDQPVSLPVEPQKESATVPSREGLHPATFTVELLLDQNYHIHSTHVMHVQSRRENTWRGLPEGQLLVDFMSQNAGPGIPSVEPAFPNIEEPRHAPPIVVEKAKPRLAGTFRVRAMELVGIESENLGKMLPGEQPFNVRLTLDLSELNVPGGSPLNYKASIYGKSLGSISGLVVGEAQGIIKSTDTAIINVVGNLLSQGTYEVAATVALALSGTKPTARSGTIALINGGLIRVY
jgi:hypothetical protein